MEKEQIEIHNTIKEKKQRLLDLKEKLSGLISKRDHLLITKKANLEAIYSLRIGKYEYKLVKAECDAARLRRKIELIQAQANKGQEIDLEQIQKVLENEYREWEEKIRNLVETIKKADSRLKSLLSPEDSRLIQKLYRKLVKLLHPDVNDDIGKMGKILWQRLQDAYRLGDLEEIKMIDLLIDDDERQIKVGDAKKLDEVIKSYTGKMRQISDQIINILSCFPFDIEQKLEDSKWVSRKVRGIEVKIKEKLEYIEELNHIVDLLILRNICTGGESCRG